MIEAWINFGIVIFAQLCLFLICAFYEKRLKDIPYVLGMGILISIVVSIPFDLIMGKFFGLHSFVLGFGLPFLFINSIFSYGLFVANILLLQYVRLSYFIFWNITIIAVYEIINNFFRVWTWGFVLPPFQFILILIIGYITGAILAALISHILLKYRFVFIDNLLKK